MTAADPEDPTTALLRAASEGDAGSLDRLLRQHQSALLERIRKMMGDGARSILESGDVLQDTMGDILDGIGAFGPGDEERFLRWASTIAQNNLRDQLRRRRQQLLESVTGCLDTNTPSRAAARRDVEDVVRQAIEALPADYAAVIDMRDLQQLSFEAIAQRMGRTDNAVQLLHTRALTKLGQILRSRLEQG
jgi:RNA polymerase sigma-70 factor (ECF subfamily)